MSIGIIGLGSYLPEHVLTNDAIEAMSGFDRSAKGGRSLTDWTRRYHGGMERRRAADGEATSDLATAAARAALADAGLAAADVDLLIMATVSSDCRLPPSAAFVQANLGFHGKFLQLDSACTGFIDAVLTARALLESAGFRRALIVCADTCRPWLNPKDWLSQSVFGDGAAAVILSEVPDGYGFTYLLTESEGEIGHYVRVEAGGSRQPLTPGLLGSDSAFLNIEFSNVHTWGVPRMVDAVKRILKEAGLTSEGIDWVVAHQASARMLHEAADELSIPVDRFVITYPKVGNTVGSSLPIALDEGYRTGLFQNGDLILMPAVGAGMAWGAALYRWGGRA